MSQASLPTARPRRVEGRPGDGMDVRLEPPSPWRRYRRWGLGAAAAAVTTLLLARVGPAVPAVAREGVVVDSVRRGAFVRDVRASGVLEPESARIVAALTAGRVDRLAVRAGSRVTPRTVLVELTNPDAVLQSLEAERGLAAAEATLASQRTALEAQRLAQVVARASARSALAAARREMTVMEALDAKRLAAPFEVAGARDRLREQIERDSAEARRLALLAASMDRELSLQLGQVERLRAISRFHHDRVASMRVEAGDSGVLQELPVELGQWVTPGMILGRVARAGGLKAALRVPETQAKDVAVGQGVMVDTRNGVVAGRVARVDPRVQQGSVLVEVTLPPVLPRGARPDLSVDGTIELERRDDVLFVGRPMDGQPDAMAWLFKVSDDGSTAIRTSVRLGAASASAIEVLGGLAAGDRIIVSDMSSYQHAGVIRLR